MIIDSRFKIHKGWNVKLVEDYAWKDFYKLMIKYKSFLKFDSESFKLILKGLMS